MEATHYFQPGIVKPDGTIDTDRLREYGCPKIDTFKGLMVGWYPECAEWDGVELQSQTPFDICDMETYNIMNEDKTWMGATPSMFGRVLKTPKVKFFTRVLPEYKKLKLATGVFTIFYATVFHVLGFVPVVGRRRTALTCKVCKGKKGFCRKRGDPGHLPLVVNGDGSGSGGSSALTA